MGGEVGRGNGPAVEIVLAVRHDCGAPDGGEASLAERVFGVDPGAGNDGGPRQRAVREVGAVGELGGYAFDSGFHALAEPGGVLAGPGFGELALEVDELGCAFGLELLAGVQHENAMAFAEQSYGGRDSRRAGADDDVGGLHEVKLSRWQGDGS